MKDPKKVKMGKKSRAAGKRFELKVKDDLETHGWIVSRWNKNIHNSQFIDCKPKFNPFTKSLMMNSGGFPDFICIKNNPGLSVLFVECKMNGIIDKEEKEKLIWMKEQGFKVMIAKKGLKRGEIEYENIV